MLAYLQPTIESLMLGRGRNFYLKGGGGCLGSSMPAGGDLERIMRRCSLYRVVTFFAYFIPRRLAGKRLPLVPPSPSFTVPTTDAPQSRENASV